MSNKAVSWPYILTCLFFLIHQTEWCNLLVPSGGRSPKVWLADYPLRLSGATCVLYGAKRTAEAHTLTPRQSTLTLLFFYWKKKTRTRYGLCNYHSPNRREYFCMNYEFHDVYGSPVFGSVFERNIDNIELDGINLDCRDTTHKWKRVRWAITKNDVSWIAVTRLYSSLRHK